MKLEIFRTFLLNHVLPSIFWHPHNNPQRREKEGSCDKLLTTVLLFKNWTVEALGDMSIMKDDQRTSVVQIQIELSQVQFYLYASTTSIRVRLPCSGVTRCGEFCPRNNTSVPGFISRDFGDIFSSSSILPVRS
jgi:hypothetical protein